MKAELLFKRKYIDSNGGIVEAVIWKLPKRDNERPHRLKYRLYYGDKNGKCLIRYDNEKGKGDHKHIRNNKSPYNFTTVEKLFEDFMNDISLLRDAEVNDER
jgi:hypothetical protein